MNFFNNIKDFFKNLSKFNKLLFLFIIITLLCVISIITWYNFSLTAVSNKNEPVKVDIEIGSVSSTIAEKLYSAGVIKNKQAFKLYIKLNKVSGLQAGNYTFNKNMNVEKIIEILKTGKIMKEQINITFVEGKNMRWIAKKISSSTSNTEQQVFDLLKDEKYIDSLIDEYWFITDDIKQKDIYYALEGYLFPDTYAFDDENVTVKEIFKSMLDKMEMVLTELEVNEKDVHAILSLASIVELEGLDLSSRKTISSVFYNRLQNNMSLGSDVTTYYAYNIDMGERDLTNTELYTYNPYNTRGPNMSGKLPVGPIASPSLSSIQAAAYPDSTNYLYFVSDKNGKIYFAKTLSEHEQIITNLKNNNLWFTY